VVLLAQLYFGHPHIPQQNQVNFRYQELNILKTLFKKYKKNKAIPITGLGGL
jgi:hypothetical protein